MWSDLYALDDFFSCLFPPSAPLSARVYVCEKDSGTKGTLRSEEAIDNYPSPGRSTTLATKELAVE